MKTHDPNLAELTALRSNETNQQPYDQLSRILDQAQVGISNCSRDQRFKYVNKAYAEQQGLTPEQIIGKPIVEILGAAAYGAFKPYIDEVLTGKQVEQEVLVNYERLGEQRWIHIDYTPEYNDADVIGWVAVVKDISKRKQAELELQQSKALLQSVIDAPNIGLAVYKAIRDAKGNVIDFVHEFINTKTKQALPKDFTGLKLTDHGEAGVAQLPDFINVLKTGNPSRYTRQATNLPGAPWMLFTNARVDADRIVHTWEDITDRVEAEQKLAAGKEELQQLANAMPQVVWIADSNGNVDYYNDRVLAFDGVKQNSNGTWKWEPIVHPDDLQSTIDAWQHAVATKSIYFKEHRIRFINGDFRWHLSRAIPMLDKSGNVVRWYGTATDIHELKTAEQTAKEHEQQLSLIYANVNDILFYVEVLDNGRFRYETVNRQFLVATGLTEERVIGKYVDDVLAKSSVPTVLARYKEAVESKQTVTWEQTSPYTTGIKTGVVSVTPVINQQGVCTHLVGNVYDISERKQTEMQLQRSEERFRALVTATSDVVYRMSPDWSVMYHLDGKDFIQSTNDANASWLDLYIHPDDKELVTKAFRNAIESKSVFQLEHPVLRTDGTIGWTFSRAVPVLDSNGNIEEWFGAATDITRRVETEQMLRYHNERFDLVRDGAEVGFWFCDLPFDELIWDNRVKEHFWLPPNARVTIDTFYERLHPDDRERTRQAIESSIANKQQYDIDYRSVSPDGKQIKWLRAVGRGFYDASGNPIRFDGVTTDITERKLAEEAMRRMSEESESQRRFYETVLSATPDLMYVFDLDHRFTFANEALLRMWGKSWDEAIGKTCWELDYEPWHAEMHDREIEHVKATGQSIRGEVPFNGTNGRRIYDYIFVPVFGINGDVTAVAGATRDVTDIRVAESALRESEKRFRNMADHAPVMVWVTEVDGTCTYLSQSWYGFTGQTEETGLGFGWVNAVHPDDRQLAHDAFVNANEKHEPFRVEYRLRNKNGEYRWAIDSAQPRLSPSGAFLGYIGSVIDITERKEAELANERANKRFAIAETALDGYVYEYNVATGVVWRSSNFKQVLGYEIGEVLATSDAFHQLIHPDDDALVAQQFNAAFASDQSHFIAEYRVRKKSGDYTWIRDHGIIERDAAGNALRMTGSAVNIHEHKLFTQELERLVNERTMSLQQSTSSLERLNAELASFAYVASHDLREPIRKVLSFGDYLVKREKEKLSERGMDYLARMHGAALRMDGMLDDLLAFSRVNTWETKRELLDLNAMVSQAKSTLNERIEKANASIMIDPLPAYNGIAFQFRQLFVHLLDNAIKFRKPDVQPVVEITNEVVKGSSFEKLDPSRDYLRVSVKDNGIGIEPQYHDRIFELFQRLHSKDKFNGTGIGLSICRKVVENHQGVITVDSLLGEGSTFHVFLPLER